jgi:regulator of replication initiation timing
MNFDFNQFKERLGQGLVSTNTMRTKADSLLESNHHQLHLWEEKITTLKSGTPEYKEAEKKIKKYKGLLHIK